MIIKNLSKIDELRGQKRRKGEKVSRMNLEKTMGDGKENVCYP